MYYLDASGKRVYTLKVRVLRYGWWSCGTVFSLFVESWTKPNGSCVCFRCLPMDSTVNILVKQSPNTNGLFSWFVLNHYFYRKRLRMEKSLKVHIRPDSLPMTNSVDNE